MANGVKFGRKPKLSPYQRAEAIKRRAAGEALASIARSYAVDISMISRLSRSVPGVPPTFSGVSNFEHLVLNQIRRRRLSIHAHVAFLHLGCGLLGRMDRDRKPLTFTDTTDVARWLAVCYGRRASKSVGRAAATKKAADDIADQMGAADHMQAPSRAARISALRWPRHAQATRGRGAKLYQPSCKMLPAAIPNPFCRAAPARACGRCEKG